MPSHTEEEEAYRSFSRTVLSSSNSEHRALIEEGAHFSRHQLAIHMVRNTAGASEAIVMLMTALIKDSSCGIMTPIPQYPLLTDNSVERKLN